ncbi:DUF805 domain-containing protein [Pseudovibrio sp. Tun.PSC04-5.I4]|uniref:DUF805 domain-containing protein n=1 Tax=Pseudovibrio sp. Tun.PSC04-5.I4 TaxID=1798213 RepID=UPI00088E5944|nr:DUF805 domain-containing protein [Pseudovibrio sp. Tun.PSC04-5.I4]SDR18076.1 Uncharacterized membrane protein YhaH, DUF805 family [Pseudovibrio sp. Tun.PSC04-5.I4]
MPKQEVPKPSLLWLFFSPFGRISRAPYWLAFGFTWCILFIAFNVTSHMVIDVYTANGSLDIPLEMFVNDMFAANPLLAPMVFASKFTELMLVMKRLQDRGLTSFIALLIFLPFVNFLIVFAAGFLKSQPGPNKYGPYSNTRPLPRKK